MFQEGEDLHYRKCQRLTPGQEVSCSELRVGISHSYINLQWRDSKVFQYIGGNCEMKLILLKTIGQKLNPWKFINSPV
mgnify:CR=1 FL=1